MVHAEVCKTTFYWSYAKQFWWALCLQVQTAWAWDCFACLNIPIMQVISAKLSIHNKLNVMCIMLTISIPIGGFRQLDNVCTLNQDSSSRISIWCISNDDDVRCHVGTNIRACYSFSKSIWSSAVWYMPMTHKNNVSKK